MSTTAELPPFPRIISDLGKHRFAPGSRGLVAVDAAKIEERFEQVWAKYPPPYREVIDAARNAQGIRVITDENSIPAGVRVAGHMGGHFYFRPTRLSAEQLDTVIIHEIAHYFVDAKDGNSWLDYQAASEPNNGRNALTSRLLLSRAEAEAVRIEHEVREKLGLGNEVQLDWRRIARAAKQRLLIVCPAPILASDLLPDIAAAEQTGVVVTLLLGFDSAQIQPMGWLQPLAARLAVYWWPDASHLSPSGVNLGRLDFVCVSADRSEAFVGIVNRGSGGRQPALCSGLLINGNDAAELQDYFEKTIHLWAHRQ